jgi:hypothetical protein
MNSIVEVDSALRRGFAAVAVLAEGLEVLGGGRAAFGPGDFVVDVEDCFGVGSGGAAAVNAFKIIAL